MLALRRLALSTRAVATAARRTPAMASFSADAPAAAQGGDNVVYPVQAMTLEWVLDSPPALHCFEEPPLVVECTDNTNCEYVNPAAH